MNNNSKPTTYITTHMTITIHIMCIVSNTIIIHKAVRLYRYDNTTTKNSYYESS